MPKNPNQRSKPVKRDEPMTGAMKFFLAGCVAELYLLIVRRFYVGGNAEQQIAWYDSYLWILAGLGAAALVVGLILTSMWKNKGKKRVIGWYTAGGGAFLAVSALLIRALNAPMVTLLTVVVPVVMLLVILWSLYDRECAVSLTVLGVSLIFLWVCRRMFPNLQYGTLMRGIAVLYLVLLAAAAVLARKAEQNGGKLGKLCLLPANADLLPIYTACGLSAAAIAVALLYAPAAYYAMWVLAVVVFALAVYYTVKQL